MTKQSKENFRRQKRKLQKASQRPAQEEVIRFRLDRTTTLSAYALAATKQTRLGSMVRNWVLEHIAEEGGAAAFPKLKIG